MSRSDKMIQQAIRTTRMGSGFVVLCLALLTVGCDGGLFGTGSGSELNDAQSPPDLQSPNADAPQTGAQPSPQPEEGMPEDGGVEVPSENAPGLDNQTPVVNHSNTLPSALDTSTAPLPAVKLVNLTTRSVSVVNDSSSDSVSAPPATTSEWLPVNTGETALMLSDDQNDTLLVRIDPLNSVNDGLTTLVVSQSAGATDPVSTSSIAAPVSVLPLDTLAVVTAPQMAEVRIIDVNANRSGITESRYSLTPVDNNTTGSELAFSGDASDAAMAGGYQLASPGTYRLDSAEGNIAQALITLQANEVYTLLLAGDLQPQIYIETDSQLPAE